jgi:hypothetical protein
VALARRIAQQQPQIQQMLARGWTISAIARELNLDRKTVRYADIGITDVMPQVLLCRPMTGNHCRSRRLRQGGSP